VASAAPTGSPAVKPLRTLYSVFKKLKPGQIKGGRREE
jgi:hypothetical protein